MAKLERPQQLALYTLLATRSYFRGTLEGTFPLTDVPDDLPPKDQEILTSKAPPESGAEIVLRAKHNLPTGITEEDITKANLHKLFVGSSAPQQIRNITTDPERIAVTLADEYVPGDPRCPDLDEGNEMVPAIIAALQPAVVEA